MRLKKQKKKTAKRKNKSKAKTSKKISRYGIEKIYKPMSPKKIKDLCNCKYLFGPVID